MPVDYLKYPPDWPERRLRILERAKNRCELCGVENYSAIAGGLARVILTVAHLDHDEENFEVTDERLAALCQRCHLRYDAQEKARRRRVKRYAKSLFPI